jgi:hypothetical protein
MHFSSENWTDFARHLAPPVLATTMRTHLEEGCAACAGELSFWQSTTAIAAGEPECEPPEYLLRRAKAAFAEWAWMCRQTGLVAKPVFDTWLRPAAAGVRSGAAVARQMIFEAGDLTIDIQLQPGTRPGESSVLGQIVRADEPNAGVPDAQLSARSGGTVVARAHSNEFGEFSLPAVPDDAVTLAIRLDGGRTILIGLPEGRGRSLRTGEAWL